MRRHICFKCDKRYKHVKTDVCTNFDNTILFCLSCFRKMETFAHKHHQRYYGRGEIVCRECASCILAMDERFGGNYLDDMTRSAARTVLFG